MPHKSVKWLGVDVGTKDTLQRVAKTSNRKLFTCLQMLAFNFERRVLSKLSKDERARYLAGKLTVDETLALSTERFARLADQIASQGPPPTAPENYRQLEVDPETWRRLRRLGRLLNCKLVTLLGALAVGWEKKYLDPMTEEESAKYLSGQMTPQEAYEIYWRNQNPPPVPAAEQVAVPEIAPAPESSPAELASNEVGDV
jgi:hypothetical protein